MMQVRVFLDAAERAEREMLAGQFAVQLVAARGDQKQVKAMAEMLKQ